MKVSNISMIISIQGQDTEHAATDRYVYIRKCNSVT